MPYPIVFFFYRIAYYLVRIAFSFTTAFLSRAGKCPEGHCRHLRLQPPQLSGSGAGGNGCPHPFNFIAKEPLFRNPVFGGFIRLMGAFPTADAKHPDYDMLSEATKRLDKRRHLTIFRKVPATPTARSAEEKAVSAYWLPAAASR